MSSVTQCQADRKASHWWLFGAAILSSFLLSTGLWAVVVQGAVLVIASQRLRTPRPRGETIVLWAAISLIVLTLVAAGAVTIAAFALTGGSTEISVPVAPR
jgi:O-antigen ligase